MKYQKGNVNKQSLLKLHKKILRGHIVFRGRSPLCPPLPGKVIKLSFSTSPPQNKQTNKQTLGINLTKEVKDIC